MTTYTTSPDQLSGVWPSNTEPGVWDRSDSWSQRLQDDIDDGPLNEIRDTAENVEKGMTPCIVSIGPSSIHEMVELREISGYKAHILGIEAHSGRHHDITEAIHDRGLQQELRVFIGNGWYLADCLPAVLPEEKIVAIVAANSLGIAIHSSLSESVTGNYIQSFLNQAKQLFDKKGLLLISVGTAVMELEFSEDTFIWRPHNCYEAVFRQVTRSGPNLTTPMVTNMWPLWIGEFQKRGDFKFLDIDDNIVRTPTPTHTHKITSLNFRELVPCRFISEKEVQKLS
ncbi:hypothetical protein JW710_04995 [Candidatus Dojkabacteria bacterium]|nr:hypothetical protein [Candidatus Dojkabacteria bacterium]